MAHPPQPAQVSAILARMADGDPAAAGELLPLVYAELRSLADRAMRDERASHTLQPTALVHEAWLRLARDERAYDDRRHFLRVAARAMRNLLVDHARARRSAKRGGGAERLPLDEAAAHWERDELDLVALDEALGRLAAHDDELARIVELRFFGGLTLEETGDVLGLTVRQVHRAWTTARAWLHRELERGS